VNLNTGKISQNKTGLVVMSLFTVQMEWLATIIRQSLLCRDYYRTKRISWFVAFSEVAFCPIDTTFYITQNETELDIKFLFYLLERLDLTRLTADVGVPGLNREMAYREIIAYPKDANAQKEIINSVGGIEERIKAAKNKLASYQNLFKTLLHELMSGAKKVEI